jgi:DNA-binding Xre family transcriptional regulator
MDVSLESLEKIALVLDCEIGDLIEIVKKNGEED